MVIRNVGRSLLTICPHFVGSKVTEHFDLVKPLVEFKFNTVRSVACCAMQSLPLYAVVAI
jgi:hypothetical protein